MIMPKRPATHIQNTAPGPPTATADIADADGGAKRGAHCFKRGENASIVLIFLFAVENAVERMLHGHAEAAELEKARANSNINAGSKNQNNEWKTP